MSRSKISIVKMSTSAMAVLLSASFALAQQIGELHNSIGMVFVYVPAGEFMMGRVDARAGWDSPADRVQISQPFYLGKYEVTQGQWQTVMGSNPSSYFKGDLDRPVGNVSWHDAQEFIKRLNDWEGRGEIYHLPTEAEWEYASRVGKDEFQPRGQPNAWGLHGMYDSMFELMQDWYGSHGPGASTDPTGPSSGSHRVVRGYCSDGWDARRQGACRSAARGATPLDYRTPSLGFRLLRTLR